MCSTQCPTIPGDGQAIESFKAAARSPAWAVCRMRVVSVVAYFMVSNG